MMRERKSAVLLLINVALLCAFGWAGYHGDLATIWHADALKLSFIIMPLFFIAGFGLALGLITDDLAEEIEARLPMIALTGTVYGILLVFSVLAEAKLGTASDLKTQLPVLLSGGGSAMWPTFIALAGSNVLWAQLMIYRRWKA